MQLTDFKILTFDVYGTLIDWESGMFTALAPLLAKLPIPLSRDQVLQAHAYHESNQQQWTPAMPYQRLLATVYRRLAEDWSIPVDWAACEAYGNSVRNWPAFPDSAEALHYLQRHYRLCVLSNVDAESFKHSNERLGVTFDHVYTAEDIGSYKPSDRNFDYMIAQLSRIGIQKSEILHTAESMFHDHQPANRFGLASAWIYRRHDKPGFGATMNPGEMPRYDFQFNSMADLVAAHKAALSEQQI